MSARRRRRELKPRSKPWSYDGRIAARHPLVTIGLVLVLTVLSAPILFARNASSANEAWVSVDPVRDGESQQPGIHIKQAWIFGDGMMKALEKETLADATAVQAHLLKDAQPYRLPSEAPHFGPAIHTILSTLSCSESCLGSDAAILDAVNRATDIPSPANIMLRPASVLAAPSVRSGRVVAADAIIVTLLYPAGSSAGDVWDRNAMTLESGQSRWNIRQRPSEQGSRLAKVQYRAADAVDTLVFCVIWTAAMACVAWNLRRAAVLKSWLAQLAAVVVEICASTILALALTSFAGIDISTIPWKAYSITVVPQCLRNSVHFVGEVERTSPHAASSRRVSASFKRLGTAPFLAAFVNVAVFALLSADAASGLATFCRVAIVAITVDLVLFLTFFGAVAGLNLRKLGLEESSFGGSSREAVSRKATGEEQRGSEGASQGWSSRPDAIGNLLMLACVSFLVFCFRGGIQLPSKEGLQAFLRQSFTGEPATWRRHDSLWKPDATAWLRAQDASTLEGIMRLASPPTSSFVVRVHEPLVVTPRLAMRNTTASGDVASALKDTFPRDGVWIPTFALCGAIVAALALWNTFFSDEVDELQGPAEPSDVSSACCLPPAHTLDVFHLASGPRRFLVSVGFDREVRLWDLESPTPTNHLIPCEPKHGVFWPITMVSIDSRAEWIAICSHGGHVALWNRQQERFGLSTTVDGKINTCVFARISGRERFHAVTSRLLLVLERGALTDVNIDTGNVVTTQICDAQVRSAHIISNTRMPARLTTITERDGIFISTNREGWWSTRPLQLAALDFASPGLKQSLRFSVIPSLRGVGIAYDEEKSSLHLVDLFSGTLIYTLRPRSIKFSTLRAFHSPPQSCIYCGSTSVASFSFAYAEKKDGALIMTTISAENNPQYRTGLICLRSERDARERRCAGFASAAEVTHVMPDPGVWEVTGANGVAGVRRREEKNHVTSSRSIPGSGLINRRARSTPTARTAEEKWEAWTMTAKGIVNSHMLTTSLLAGKSGPACRLARNAVAVGLADIIALVQFGNHLHDNDEEEGLVAKPTHHGRLSRQSSRISRHGA